MDVPNLQLMALFVQKVIRGSQNFEIWSRDLGHAHVGVVLWSGRSRGPSSMSVLNLYRNPPTHTDCQNLFFYLDPLLSYG